MRCRNLICDILICLLLLLIVLIPIQATSKGYTIRSGDSIASEINFQACMNEEVDGKVIITANPENTESCEIKILWTAMWLDFNPTSFVLNPGASREVKIMVNTTGLTPDRYATTIVVKSNLEPKETLFTITLDVITPQLKIEPDTANWALPFIGESSKEIVLSSERCQTSFQLTYEPLNIPDLTISINPLSSVLEKNKPVKIGFIFYSQGFLPNESITLTITISSPFSNPITGKYKISSIGEVPIKSIHEILSGMPLKEEEYMIHGYNETKMQIPSSEGFSKMTFNPFSQITLDADYFNSYLEVNDPHSIVEWDPLTWPKMSYAKVHGMIQKASNSESGKLSVNLTKPIKHYFKMYYPYKDSLWNFNPDPITLGEATESSDRAIIIGSSGFPSDWVDVDLLSSWSACAAFLPSPQQLKVFYSLGVFPENTYDTNNVKTIKQQIKPYMMPGKVTKIIDYLAQVELEMRNELLEGKNPSLTLFITGYSSIKEQEPRFYLSPSESLSPKDLAKILEKITLLCPVKILLNTSHAGYWETDLTAIGNLEIILSCRDKEDVFYHARDFEALVIEYLKSRKAGDSLGKVNWRKLVSDVQINIPFYKDGAHFESKTTGVVKFYCQSKINPSYYLVNGDFINIQKYRDPREKFEYKTPFNITFPVLKKSFHADSTDCADYIGFDPPDLHLQSTPYLAQSKPIDVEGVVIAIDKNAEEFQIKISDGVEYRVIYPVRPIPVKIQDKVRIQGSLRYEKIIIPEFIEVLEQKCQLFIDPPKSLTIYPSCLFNKEESGHLQEEKVLEWNVINQGDIAVDLSWISIIDQLTDDLDIVFTLEWIDPPKSTLHLLPGESRKIQAKALFHQIPEKLTKEVKFRVSTQFTLSPAPPCTELQVNYLDVTVYPNRRTIKGKVYFQNAEGNPCAIKNFPIRLYLRYEPECKTDYQFQKANGNTYLLEDLAYQDLPKTKYYAQTTTDENGEYSFGFFDYDGKEEYRILLIFQKSEFRMIYRSGKNTFFAYTDVGQNAFRDKEIFEKNIAIGYDQNLISPTGISAGAVAQSLCYIDECFAVFMKENCGNKPIIRQDLLPLSVNVGSSTQPMTCYDALSRCIHLVETDSKSFNQPQSREWHEFGHFLIDCLGILPSKPANDEWHRGVLNSTSACSLSEGLAEILSLVMLKEVKTSNSCCGTYIDSQNGLYYWSGGVTDIERDLSLTFSLANQYGYYDGNHHWVSVPYSDVSVASSGKLVHRLLTNQEIMIQRSFEEFAAASLLLDLIDSNEWYKKPDFPSEWQIGDDDLIQNISWQELLCLFMNQKINSIDSLYRSLIEKYQKNQTIRAHIAKLFVDKGFYEDFNHNQRYDGNEKIGSTYRFSCSDGKTNYPLLKSRPSIPTILGSAVKIHLTDTKNASILSARVKIDIMTGKDGASFSYIQEVQQDEILSLYLTPNSGGRIRLSLVNGYGKVFLLSEESLWKSVGEGNDFAETITWITDEPSQKGDWQWNFPEMENVQLIQNHLYQYSISYWNTGNTIMPVDIESTSSWIRVYPESIKNNSGMFIVRLDTSKIGLGTFKGKIYIKQNNHIVFTFPISIFNASPVIVLQLSIGHNKALVDEKEVTLDSVPYIKKPGRTMVPMRFIAEGFGSQLDYAPKKGLVKDIWIYFRFSTIHLTMGLNQVEVDGKKIIIDAPAEIIKGRTFVPIRAIAEIFGAQVDWKASNQTITIHLTR